MAKEEQSIIIRIGAAISRSWLGRFWRWLTQPILSFVSSKKSTKQDTYEELSRAEIEKPVEVREQIQEMTAEEIAERVRTLRQDRNNLLNSFALDEVREKFLEFLELSAKQMGQDYSSETFEKFALPWRGIKKSDLDALSQPIVTQTDLKALEQSYNQIAEKVRPINETFNLIIKEIRDKAGEVLKSKDFEGLDTALRSYNSDADLDTVGYTSSVMSCLADVLCNAAKVNPEIQNVTLSLEEAQSMRVVNVELAKHCLNEYSHCDDPYAIKLYINAEILRNIARWKLTPENSYPARILAMQQQVKIIEALKVEREQYLSQNVSLHTINPPILPQRDKHIAMQKKSTTDTPTSSEKPLKKQGDKSKGKSPI